MLKCQGLSPYVIHSITQAMTCQISNLNSNLNLKLNVAMECNLLSSSWQLVII